MTIFARTKKRFARLKDRGAMMWPTAICSRQFISRQGIAMCALLVSVVHLYFSFLREHDNVRIVLKSEEGPAIARDQSGALVPQFDVAVTFINAGTRAAAITQVTFVVEQTKLLEGKYNRTDCKRTPVGYFYNFEPKVLKPGEISTAYLELVEYASLSDVKEDTEVLLICLRFTSINPYSDEQSKDISIMSQDLKSLKVIWVASEKQPITIMR